MYINRWEKNVAYPYSGRLIGHKREWRTDTHNNIDDF